MRWPGGEVVTTAQQSGQEQIKIEAILPRIGNMSLAVNDAIMMPYYCITVLLEELHVDKKSTVIRRQLTLYKENKRENTKNKCV